MRIRWSLCPIPAVLAALFLSGCDDGGGSDRARIRLLNVSPGYTSLDLYANGEDDDTDQQRIAGVAYDTVSDYAELKSGTYDVKFKRAGVSLTRQRLNIQQLADATQNAFAIVGATGPISTLHVGGDTTPLDTALGKATLLHAPHAGMP